MVFTDIFFLFCYLIILFWYSCLVSLNNYEDTTATIPESPSPSILTF